MKIKSGFGHRENFTLYTEAIAAKFLERNTTHKLCSVKASCVGKSGSAHVITAKMATENC